MTCMPTMQRVLNYQVLVAYDPWKIASHEFDEHIATEDDNECTTDVDKYLNEASEKNREGFIFWLGGR